MPSQSVSFKNLKMKSLSAFVFIFVTINFSSSDALECYECVFYDGYNHSDSSCQNDPSTSLLKTCDGHPSLPAGEISSEISVCKKVTGILDGKPAVQRNCSRSFSESVGKCYSTDTIIIENRITNAAYGCICNEDRCNEASNFTSPFILSFAIVVNVLNKFIIVTV